MKWLIISDLHGSFASTRQVLKYYKSNNIDKILILGDILYHGPRNSLPEDYNPKSLAELLNTYKDIIISIKGNCDSEVDQMVLNFSIENSTYYFFENNREFLACHGHHLEENLSKYKNDICIIHGHTHIPKAEKINDRIYLNPGSISLPKEGHPKTFGVLDNNKFTIYLLDTFEKYMEINL